MVRYFGYTLSKHCYGLNADFALMRPHLGAKSAS